MYSDACGSYFQLIAYPSPNPSPPNPWAFLITGTLMSNRQNDKSIFQGMDFGKLEQTAMLTLGKTIHDQVENGTESDLYAAMQVLIQKGWTTSRPFNVHSYIPPEPHLKSKVDRIIDKFWLSPCYDEMHLYLAQIQKNPRTKDVFKGKSTTHHYPWYRRGSKY
ncbi:hypothetical protein [Escherichia phage ST4]|nr:hypothetical protein [Escherichia phage ST4]